MFSTAHTPSEHRTQAERSAKTRSKVIDAAIACIAEDGFKQATTKRVARRAGVTWGTIQLDLVPELEDFSREVEVLDGALLNLLSPSPRG